LADQLEVGEGGGVVRLADKKDGGGVDALPDGEGGLAVDGEPLHGLQQEEGAEGGAVVEGREEGVRIGGEGHAPEPHHGAEIAGERVAAGVMAADDVLGVILLIVKDGRGGRPVVAADEAALGNIAAAVDFRVKGGIKHAFGDDEIIHGLMDGGAGRVLVHSGVLLVLDDLEESAEEPVEVAVKMGLLDLHEHVVEDEVEGVEEGVGGDEDGDILLARLVVEVVHLLVAAVVAAAFGGDEKMVAREEVALGSVKAEIAGVDHIAEVGSDAVALRRRQNERGLREIGAEFGLDRAGDLGDHLCREGRDAGQKRQRQNGFQRAGFHDDLQARCGPANALPLI